MPSPTFSPSNVGMDGAKSVLKLISDLCLCSTRYLCHRMAAHALQDNIRRLPVQPRMPYDTTIPLCLWNGVFPVDICTPTSGGVCLTMARLASGGHLGHGFCLPDGSIYPAWLSLLRGAALTCGIQTLYVHVNCPRHACHWPLDGGK
jgi:hypothetical protein